MLLRNGFFSTAGKYSIQSTNTCAFDSLYIAAVALYADSTVVKKQIDGNDTENNFLQMVSNMFDNVGRVNVKQNKLLRLRNLILLEIFRDSLHSIEFINSLISIDCASNPSFIIPKVLPKEFYSYLRKKQCNQCSREIISNRCFIDINFDQYETLGIKKLNECLLQSLINEPTSTCQCNGSEVVVQTEFSSFIIIDLQLKQEIIGITLKDIPKTLNILGIRFALKSCIEFIGNTKTKQIGHYVTHVYRNDMWELYDDMKATVLKSKNNVKKKIQVVFYAKIM